MPFRVKTHQGPIGSLRTDNAHLSGCVRILYACSVPIRAKWLYAIFSDLVGCQPVAVSKIRIFSKWRDMSGA